MLAMNCPNILFLISDEPPPAEAVTRFRGRLSERGHGPNADPNDTNADYRNT